MEPQSTAFFLLLIVVFGGLMWWMAVAKQLVLRVLAACLAFIPAMAFSTFLGSSVDQAVAAQFGFTAHLEVSGKLSHITRNVYVYLLPQLGAC